jgi:hypothetical protein
MLGIFDACIMRPHLCSLVIDREDIRSSRWHHFDVIHVSLQILVVFTLVIVKRFEGNIVKSAVNLAQLFDARPKPSWRHIIFTLLDSLSNGILEVLSLCKCSIERVLDRLLLRYILAL